MSVSRGAVAVGATVAAMIGFTLKGALQLLNNRYG